MAAEMSCGNLELPKELVAILSCINNNIGAFRHFSQLLRDD